MKTMKIVFLLSFVINSSLIFGQNCANFHNEKCRWADDTFLYSRQSKSALFSKGMKSEFVITVYDEEYYISVQGDPNLEKIKIRVKEDNANKTVLYDNSNFNHESFFYFKNEKTRNLIIEITSEAEKKFSGSSERFCLGVLIQYKR